jgi:hypothetical protein
MSLAFFPNWEFLSKFWEKSILFAIGKPNFGYKIGPKKTLVGYGAMHR